MWETGEIQVYGTEYKWQAKVFTLGSEFGINDGRVSKLFVEDKKTGEQILNYDRGWDIPRAYPMRETTAGKVLEAVLRDIDKGAK